MPDLVTGSRAITHRDDATEIAPQTDGQWEAWVAATATRAWAREDPLLDWLDLYGREHGFVPDPEAAGYDPRTDFARFIKAKGLAFEDEVIDCLRERCEVESVPRDDAGARSLDTAEKTFQRMREGAPIIYQAVLRNPQTRTYGSPDLLVRSDVLRDLFPTAITEAEASHPASALPDAHWHYRVVDIKFTTLRLRANLDELTGSTWHFHVQLQLYNEALARLQGHDPEVSYLLGRSWSQTIDGEKVRGDSCLEKLGAVPQDLAGTKAQRLSEAARNAAGWVRRVRQEGADWEPLPEPSVEELRPNMNNDQDHPWNGAKREIATDLEDLTLLWRVGPTQRDEAAAHGITRWTHPDLDASKLGMGGKRGPIIDAILDVNRDTEGPPVRPDRVTAGRDVWGADHRLEFFVDFETVSDLDDDFTQMPDRGGQPLIFMIGCGHVEDGQWQFTCFVADELSEPAEAAIIDRWFEHVATTRDRLDPDGPDPLAYHWSPAEVSTLERAYNSAFNRHPDKAWEPVNWFDVCTEVGRAEPVVVRGAFGFGLKEIAKALHGHGLIETAWGEGPADGLGAMAGAWTAAREARESGVPLTDIDLMKEIEAYNQIDCRVIWEVVQYLRKDH